MAATVVEHGRRKGVVRSPGATDRATVVPAEEWDRIRGSLSKKERDGDARAAQLEARGRMHEHSQLIVSNWENTIEGQRLKKLQARKMRDEKEEAERVKVDGEEARYQAERRREAIERAKTHLYYQTDRVKQFHGALLHSEVLREREEQITYRKRKEEALKRADLKYQQLQEEERQRGIAADMQSSLERAKARSEVYHYQTKQMTHKKGERETENLKALEEQKRLEQEAAEYHDGLKAVEDRKRAEKLALREALDRSLTDKCATSQRKVEQEKAEEEEIEVFTKAKRKMTQLRKEKEARLFQEFQQRQQCMCQQLQTQRKLQQSNEDDLIARAVAEQEAKREREERQKEESYLSREREIRAHRWLMMAEQAEQRREQEQLDQRLLQQRVLQDQKFHASQLEKHVKAAEEACLLQDAHKNKMSEASVAKQEEAEEERKVVEQNMALLQVEERQFQQYADQVVSEAEGRGAPTQPLRKAAKTGAGGGRGPVFEGKGGIRPSYKVMDSTAVELPAYQPRSMPVPASTQKRMGFTW